MLNSYVIRKIVYKFVLLRSYMPLATLRMIFLALIQSVTQYGIVAWGSLVYYYLKPLILLHKRIIKICLKRPIDYPTNLIYTEFNVLTIDKIYKQNLLVFIHKNLKQFTGTTNYTI